MTQIACHVTHTKQIIPALCRLLSPFVLCHPYETFIIRHRGKLSQWASAGPTPPLASAPASVDPFTRRAPHPAHAMVSHHRHGSLAGSANGDERPRSRDYYSARRRSRRPRSRSISPEADRSSVRSGGRGAGPSRRDYGSPRVRDLYASEYLRHDELYRERSPPPSREPPRDLTLAPWQSTTTYPEYESRSVMCLHVAPQATVRDLGEFFENRLGQGVVLDVAIAKSKEEEQILYVVSLLPCI